jgi:CTP:molybdopterin cytidylyltransferase MocA
VVLAAGEGNRIGHPKALLRTDRDDESFVQRACGVLRAGGVTEVVVIVSPAIVDSVMALNPGGRVLTNTEPARGQLSSLLIAIDALGAKTQAIAVLPVDVPLVRPETVRALIDVWSRTRLPVVRPASGGRHGHPVIFDRGIFHEIMATPLAGGARPLVRRHATADGDVFTEDKGAFCDIDTVEDYHEAFGRLPARIAIR